MCSACQGDYEDPEVTQDSELIDRINLNYAMDGELTRILKAIRALQVVGHYCDPPNSHDCRVCETIRAGNAFKMAARRAGCDEV
jgi:hypothetical protein